MLSICEGCNQCPFRRNAIKGYLGESSFKPDEFLQPVLHGDIHLPCHSTVNYEVEEDTSSIVCRGWLTMMRNECKAPRNAKLYKMTRIVKPNREDYFSHTSEFKEYHSTP